MYCRSCGSPLLQEAVTCSSCGQSPYVGDKFCGSCGTAAQPGATGCIKCGARMAGYSGVPVGRESNRIAAGICGIVLGSFGVHKFILGYQKEGIIMLLVSILTCGFGASVMGVIGLIEGIIYLTKSEPEFVNMYVVQSKPWF